jgi:hypothetical protein
MDENTSIDADEATPSFLLSLPVELLVQILDLASPLGQRRKALLDYMVVCKGFSGTLSIP